MRRSFINRSYLWLRGALEPFVAIGLGILLSPLLLFAALMVKRSSPGPIIFRQVRLGHRGQAFTMYKFRTMYVEAEDSGPQWWRPEDQRVTRWGRFLRDSHLDELPQLLNVIKGELSFVGPRPERPQFYEILEKEIPGFRDRLQIKPGITGLAQVRSGYANSVEGSRLKLKYDMLYMDQASPRLDLQIVIDTLRGAKPIQPDLQHEYDSNLRTQRSSP